MKTITRLLVWIIVFFFGSTIAAVVVYKWMPVYITPLMITRSIENDDEMQHKWVPIEEISENMALAVVSSEDNLFMSHSGFDFDQIQKAIEEAEKTGRQRGASTISQQTAKNVFLWNGRSWVRKGLEAYFTVLIELI